MKEKFVQLGKDLPFRSKVTILCIVVSMIPMLLLGSLAYRHIREQLVQQETINLEDTLRRESEAIEADLDYYLNALDMIVWNDGIKSGVNRIYDTNYDLFMFYKETLDPTIHTLRTLSPDIRTVTLYTNANINSHGDKVLPLNMAERLPWYDQAMQSTVPVVRISDDGSTLYLACKMYFSYSAPTTIVSMTVDVGQMFDNAPSLFANDFGLCVADSYGDAIYETFRGQENAAFSQIPLADLQTGGFSSSTVMKQRTLHNGQWIAYLYRPLEDVRLSVRQFTGIAVIVFLACGVFSLLAARLLSKVMMRPLEQLTSDMVQVEQGHYNISVTTDDERKDEVGLLLRSFHTMVTQLNHLINEVLVSKINQQKYELKILQSQINPHFLYNSLSLINNKAIMTNQTDISQMAQLLSTFYRTMLNKGKNITTIQAELENTKAYISIQRMMHAHSFDVTYDIDESILNCPVLNLVIQPLAENAILHGLDHREVPGRGMLTVSCYPEQDDIVFKVLDNGCGISQEECAMILTAESKGYGVKNVHQRVQLYYGEGYGLSYRSTPGLGTCATLRLKKQVD